MVAGKLFRRRILATLVEILPAEKQIGEQFFIRWSHGVHRGA